VDLGVRPEGGIGKAEFGDALEHPSGRLVPPRRRSVVA
jgi:hypothetical protein